MDQNELVEKDFQIGKRFSDLLKKSSGLRVEAAFWWLEDDEWRFIVATPVVHERGRLVTHEMIRKAVGGKTKEFQSILSRLDVLSPSEGVITVLDIGSHEKTPLNRRVVDEALHGAYVHGAYFYYFAPHTYISEQAV